MVITVSLVYLSLHFEQNGEQAENRDAQSITSVMTVFNDSAFQPLDVSTSKC